jgi:(E)-4-hydroxy-3-methylbut-2-enyl-diphosphate synthase
MRRDGAQCIELAEAGSEMVRVTVNVPEARGAVPEIKQRMLDAGCTAPLIGDFHYNGHLLLTRYPDCARALDKYRINPGNVGTGTRRDEQFATICKVAVDTASRCVSASTAARSIRSSSVAKMQENTDATSVTPPRRFSTSAWISRRSTRPSWRSRAACGSSRSSSPARCRARATSSPSTRAGPADRTAAHLGLTEAAWA